MRGLFPEKDLPRALGVKVFGEPKAQAQINSPDKAGPTIARDKTCWCGRPYPHDWLGQEDGAAHPRYPD